MEKHNVDVVVIQSIQEKGVKYEVKARLEYGAPEDELKLFFKTCKSLNFSTDLSYKEAYKKEKNKDAAITLAKELVKKLNSFGFTTSGALIRRDLRGKLENILNRKPEIENLPDIPLSRWEFPSNLIEILKKKAKERIGAFPHEL